MQKLQLSIPEPCHENWQQMTPTEQGRFCNACAKEVIDFSTMTDIQVLNYFTNVPHEKICGRALPEQLDRPISSPEPPKKRLFWYWNYFVMFFMFFAKGNSAKAQTYAKPATELSPVKNAELRGDVVVKGETQIADGEHVVTGKVIDKDGNPVPFASITIKEKNRGVSADINGAYSIKTYPDAVLIISSSGYKKAEVPVGSQSVFISVLEKALAQGLTEVVISTRLGQINRRITCGTSAVKTINANPIILFEVREDNTGLPIDKAAITITRKGDNLTNKYFSDKKGICEFKQIKLNDTYFVKVEADGYEPNEFTINANDFEDRKKEWEVLLRKQKIVVEKKAAGLNITSTNSNVNNPQTKIRIMGSFTINTQPLLVIDGLPVSLSNISSVKPSEVESVEILKGTKATALYGSVALGGAIIVTTRRLKVKNLDTVSISAGLNRRVNAKMLGGMTAGYTTTYLADAKAKLMTILTDSLKVYPNPVKRNSSFSLSLKLKEAGTYQLQFTDATGKIILQKIINTVGNNHVEMLQSQNWAAGIYYVRVFNKNKLISNTSFIVQ